MLTEVTWMVPSFYGDLRLEAKGQKECRLLVEQATQTELEALEKLRAVAVKKRWCSEDVRFKEGPAILLLAPIQKVEAALTKVLKPGRETVSAVRISGGKIQEIHESTFADDSASKGEGAYREAKVLPLKKGTVALEPVKEKKAVATTVAKPERGCPPPDFPSAELKANAVLSAFLTDEQREDFARYNRFISVGGTTGHRYMVTSRHAKAIRQYERSLYDLDDNLPICTHDWSVPAPEELLALHLLVTLPGHESYLRALSE